jgi:hypothetical protein
VFLSHNTALFSFEKWSEHMHSASAYIKMVVNGDVHRLGITNSLILRSASSANSTKVTRLINGQQTLLPAPFPHHAPPKAVNFCTVVRNYVCSVPSIISDAKNCKKKLNKLLWLCLSERQYPSGIEDIADVGDYIATSFVHLTGENNSFNVGIFVHQGEEIDRHFETRKAETHDGSALLDVPSL